MRLWHKDLIPVLPRQQLLGQWRECCLIAKNIVEKGTPGHILVNRIMEYPLEHFYRYCGYVFAYMVDKGYKCDETKLLMYTDVYSCKYAFWHGEFVALDYLFSRWHNKRYLSQCYYNLQEKYDCNGITLDEFTAIHNLFLKKYYE